MAQPRQTVIYRFDPAYDPAWQFHSMPESIVGGGSSLDDARAEYEAALAFSFEGDATPAVREYVESEVDGLGIWLRLPVDHPDAGGIRDQVSRHLAAHPEDRDWFSANTTAGGDPVIVTTSADSPLSSILEQMTPHDTLILAMLGGDDDKNPHRLCAQPVSVMTVDILCAASMH